MATFWVNLQNWPKLVQGVFRTWLGFNWNLNCVLNTQTLDAIIKMHGLVENIFSILEDVLFILIKKREPYFRSKSICVKFRAALTRVRRWRSDQKSQSQNQYRKAKVGVLYMARRCCCFCVVYIGLDIYKYIHIYG